MNDSKNTQKVRYLNPNYISFSLKKTVEGQALAQEGKDVLALPGMLSVSGTE